MPPENQNPDSQKPEDNFSNSPVSNNPTPQPQSPNSNISTDELIAQFNSEPIVNKPRPKLPIIIAMIAMLILITGGVFAISSSLNNNSSSTTSPQQPIAGASDEEAAANQFIQSIRDRDKAASDALLSSAAKATFVELGGSESFYDSCEEFGEFCLGLFEESFLSKGTKSVSDYTSPEGISGKRVIYLIVEENKDPQGNCSSKSVTKLTISSILVDGNGLIDEVEPNIESGADCSFDPIEIDF